jgi:adenine-specific DNA-methyltransferase
MKLKNMNKLNMQTTNIVDENIKRIGELFPNCLTERLNDDGKPEVAIDFDQLRQELSKNIVEGLEERYQFTWPDKRNAIRLANAPTSDTLRPCREESVDFDNTQNLYIEGDNLQVLKLLRENYLGKVKMIYIDPPYNTGNDFVYNDDFSQSAGEYMHNSGQEDEEGNRLVANTESNGRFHTDWLNMIYPRLKVAKDLLSEDGVIFVSIGSAELDNTIRLCDEIFGRPNRAGIVSRQMKTGNNQGKFFTQNIDYIVVFARNADNAASLKDDMSDELINKVYNKTQENGKRKGEKYRTMGLFQASLKHGGSTYPIECPDGEMVITPNNLPWRWNEKTFKEGVSNDDIVFVKTDTSPLINCGTGGKASWNIYTKIWLNDRIEVGQLPSDLILKFENRHAAKELVSMGIPFDFPKPVALIKYILHLFTSKDFICLDFFSGSATTAHAVMQLNAEDGGKRKFIMVQLPEATDEKSEAYKSGYKNICEIGKERIRRAGKKIKEESPLTTQDLDTGFRVLKLDSSNMQDVYYTPAEFNEQKLFDDNIKPDRTEEDLLFQTMIELGIELSAKIEKRSIAGKAVWSVSDGYLMACFDEEVNETTITEIARQQPYYFVMRDSSLANDQVADNFEQIWEEYSKDTVRRIL